ncbi:xylulokinase [Paenibacillus marchantiophytorum]|uniref:Xylulose kinase n=1 Tax=Paenibacillus marchantiophytorum TaxID=1619310 RepID=A0ABQ1EMH8_9BACL|nr:xylulokinase [Paenibacillus marchantiophytorum]GFZ78731.1 xylulokinase [Paenibacillus marchantiophytorum]
MHILAFDLGTSAVKCLLMNEKGSVLHVHAERYPSYSPSLGWMEQQPENWLNAAVLAANTCMNQANCRDISVISLSGHMSALVLVDHEGVPLLPCITLSDTRSRHQSERLRQQMQQQIFELTGNPVIDAFLAPKLLWVKETFPDLYDRAHLFLFPKDYLRYRLTGQFGTDITDAGNSLFFDPVHNNWDFHMADSLGIRRSLLPRIFRSFEIAGKLTKSMADQLQLQEGIPVAAGGADMATSALGTGTLNCGDVALTIGTSATLISAIPAIHPTGFNKVTFHPHVLPNTMYALGSHFSGGLSLNWFSEVFGQSISYSFLKSLGQAAEKVPPGSHGVLYLPFLVGSGSPRFQPHMRGTFLGISSSTDRATLFRAVLEGISFNLKETLSLLERMNQPPSTIRIGGGGINIGIWPSILASIFGYPVQVLKHSDASALGAALLGGYAIGIFNDLYLSSMQLAETSTIIKPDPQANQEYEHIYAKYLDFYSSLEPLYQKYSH